MKSSEILRRAARLLERNYEAENDGYPGACFAISEVTNGEHCPYNPEDFMHRLLVRFFGRWIGYRWDDQSSRIVGLCLAAAIAESEGD